MENLDRYTDLAMSLAISYAPKLLLALVTLVIGLWLISIAVRLTEKGMAKSKTDQTLISFIGNLLSWGLKALLLISVASMVGIETTSFIAVLGAAGLAVGLALQGSLANFAGGVLIILFKPYKVGDLIEAQGHLGVVKEIQVFTTILTSVENKRIIIPNGPMSNGSITNITAEGTLRVDLSVGIAYDADISQAKQVIMGILESDERILKEPEPFIGVSEMADSSVNFVVRPWAKAEHYWDVHFDVNEKMKNALDSNGIEIPFPQRDVHLYKH